MTIDMQTNDAGGIERMQDIESASSALLSSGLTARVMTARGKVDPRREFSVSRIWTERNRMYVRLAASENQPQEDYLLICVLEGLQRGCAVLQAQDDWWDPEQQEPPQTILELTGESTLSTLDDDGFAAALSSLRSFLEKESDRTGLEAWHELCAVAKMTFGSLVEGEYRQEPLKASPDLPVAEPAHGRGIAPDPWISSSEHDPALALAASAASAWLNSSVSGYRIESLLGEGPYSWVFKGAHNKDGSLRAFKVAKPLALSGSLPSDAGRATRGLIFTTGGVSSIHPDPAQLLGFQVAKLRAVSDTRVVSVEEFVLNDQECYSRMEYVEGQSLRHLTRQRPIAIRSLISIAECLQELSENSSFQYHGDIKPENIMINDAGDIKLLDPGYFGPLDCQEDNYQQCVVTTPGYYPLLMPDDLLAFGIVLWELSCGKHPLDGNCSLDDIPSEALEDDLVEWVREAQVVGQYFLIPLLHNGRPAAMKPSLPANVELVLLKALRLKITENGKLGRGPGFGNFAQLAESLHGLIADGTAEL